MIGALAPVDVSGRWPRVRANMADAGVDGFLVHAAANIRYLTGFTGSAALLAVTGSDAVLLTDSRYAIQGPDQLQQAGAVCRVDADARNRSTAITEAMSACSRIGLEGNTVTWNEHGILADLLDAERLAATSDLIEGLRAIKDEAEIERIATAAALATAALESVVGGGFEGRSERAIALALDDHMRAAGASGPAYETIVASGPNAARPHARPTERVIAAGDLVIVDVGAVVDGYRSDMTRSFSIGPPTEEAARMLAVVAEAQAAAVAQVAGEVDISTIDRTARDTIDEAGMGELFAHGTGHGVGLDIHEAPSVSSRATGTLQPGHCITVEPGVYRAGFGGVRIEDLLVVTESGARNLTTAPKQPVVA